MEPRSPAPACGMSGQNQHHFWIKLFCVESCRVVSQKHMTTPDDGGHKVHRMILTVTPIEFAGGGGGIMNTPQCFWEGGSGVLGHSSERPRQASRDERGAQWPRQWNKCDSFFGKTHQRWFSSVCTGHCASLQPSDNHTVWLFVVRMATRFTWINLLSTLKSVLSDDWLLHVTWS